MPFKFPSGFARRQSCYSIYMYKKYALFLWYSSTNIRPDDITSTIIRAISLFISQIKIIKAYSVNISVIQHSCAYECNTLFMTVRALRLTVYGLFVVLMCKKCFIEQLCDKPTARYRPQTQQLHFFTTITIQHEFHHILISAI